MGRRNISWRGSALVSTIAGVACAALLASAGYALLGGKSLCGAASECDKNGAIVMPAAMIETSIACDTDKECAGAECDKGAEGCADADAVVVNAAQTTTEECEGGEDCCAAKDGASDAVVVNAAATSNEPEAKACCQEKAEAAKVVNVAVEAGECDALTDECLEEPMQTSPAGIKAVNSTCPMTDEPITPGLASLHEGFTIGFCCNGCKRKWDARSAEDKTAYVVSQARVVNEMCPTCPKMKPSGSNVALFEGFAVGFCSSHCQSLFENKDRAGKAAYITTVAKPINEVCPSSGNPITVNASAVYRGAVVGFCNAGCRDKFDAAPAAEKDATLVRLVSKNFQSAEACANGCCADKAGKAAD